jgi:hypothetical protein
MKKLPLLLIILVIFVTPGLSLGGEEKCIEGDCVNGQGTYTLPDGRIYVGEFKDNKYHGQGILTFPDASKYMGEFKDGKYNGQGTYTLPDGRIYVGEFKNGKPVN